TTCSAPVNAGAHRILFHHRLRDEKEDSCCVLCVLCGSSLSFWRVERKGQRADGESPSARALTESLTGRSPDRLRTPRVCAPWAGRRHLPPHRAAASPAPTTRPCAAGRRALRPC